MSLCILPSVDIFPALAFDDDVFDVFDDIDRCLEHIHDPVEQEAMMFDDIEQCPEPICSPVQEETISPDEVTDDGSKLTLSLDVSHFKPEELNVNLDGRTLTIEGKQEVEEDDSYSMRLNNFRSFTRQWELPEDVDVEQVRSTLTEDGRLAVEASKYTNAAVSGRNIPIQKSITEE
ncbi:Hsp20/alpha crystallin family protein [Ancylostoma ceylanicum]|uniref:Hsp20/alpha crystallin family protein n=1 Tax=Ancylostoma ceylanicum TaxID=53326 RepID=A0A0D6M8X4_9BILA|nr:Hsp20/alpha crystallin family protein [Ancylostoma ceylanicum]